MNNNLIQIVFVIDKSGSMAWLADETVSGFNSFIEKYKQEDTEAILTTALFDDYCFFLHDSMDLKEVRPLTVSTYKGAGMGCTALYDAVGFTIDRVGERLAGMREEDRPHKVLFVVTTDGFENASHNYTQSRVKEMIEHQKSKYSWEFIFLGANIDSEATADSIGIGASNAVNYGFTPQGVDDVYRSVYTVASCSAKGIDASVTLDSLKDEDGFIKSDSSAVKAVVNDSISILNASKSSAYGYSEVKDDWTQLEDGRWVML